MKDKNGELPLFNALKHFNSDNKESACFYYLIDHGANINIINANGVPLLILEALQNKQYKALNYILKHPFIIDLDINDNYSPIDKAIYTNNISSVKSILRESRNNTNDDNNNRNKRKCIRYKESPFISLALAYLLNRKEIFSLLINELNINMLDNNNYSILHYVVLKEDLDTLKELIQKGADPNIQNETINPLEMAMAIENQTIISILLSSSFMDVNKYNDQGEISLITLLKMDSSYFKDKNFKLRCMKSLIDKGSNINVIDNLGKAVLYYAIEDQYNSYLMTELLLDHGVNTKISLEEHDTDHPKSYKEGNINSNIMLRMIYCKKIITLTPLFFTVKCNSLSVLKLLIERVFNTYYELFYEYKDKRTLLTYAADLGYFDIFKYLMEWDKNSKFTENESKIIDIINCCFINNRIEIFQYLLERKFNGKILPINILKFIFQSKKLGFINVLLKTNINIDLSKIRKESKELLILAMKSFQMSIISYLIKHGVDPQPVIGNKFYRNIIIHDFDLEFFKILVEHGLDINYQEEESGCTFLHYAIIEGAVEKVKYLIEQGANINVQCLEGSLSSVNEKFNCLNENVYCRIQELLDKK